MRHLYLDLEALCLVGPKEERLAARRLLKSFDRFRPVEDTPEAALLRAGWSRTEVTQILDRVWEPQSAEEYESSAEVGIIGSSTVSKPPGEGFPWEQTVCPQDPG